MGSQTQLDLPSSRTIGVKDAPRVITAQLELMSHLSAPQVPSTLRKAKKRLKTANFVLQVLSRISGAKKAAKCAANSLTHAKAWTSANALATTELTLQKTQHAVARVVSTTLMKMSSLRAMSVT